MVKLQRPFYERNDVVQIAKDLLGKVLVTNLKGTKTSGLITETEAYCGANDKACHAYGYRRTKRTGIMFGHGGVAYVYLCYGIHHLFNVVTNIKGEPDAVLIRAIEPLEGADIMIGRRNQKKLSPILTSGPGRLSQALGIDMGLNTCDLTSNILWVESGPAIEEKQISSSTRIGVQYAGEDAKLNWRFFLNTSTFVS